MEHERKIFRVASRPLRSTIPVRRMSPKAPWTQAFPNQVSKPKARVLWIRRVSKTRRPKNLLYKIKRQKFLAENPKCQCCKLRIPKGDNWSNQIHHRNGRLGPNFLDENTWAAVCMECHDFIHRNPEWAYLVGMMSKRLAKQSLLQNDKPKP